MLAAMFFCTPGKRKQAQSHTHSDNSHWVCKTHHLKAGYHLWRVRTKPWSTDAGSVLFCFSFFFCFSLGRDIDSTFKTWKAWCLSFGVLKSDITPPKCVLKSGEKQRNSFFWGGHSLIFETASGDDFNPHAYGAWVTLHCALQSRLRGKVFRDK